MLRLTRGERFNFSRLRLQAIKNQHFPYAETANPKLEAKALPIIFFTMFLEKMKSRLQNQFMQILIF